MTGGLFNIIGLVKEKYMINIKENNKNVSEFNSLYKSVGWGEYNKEISKAALDNTYYSVSVYDNDEIVGFGRIIGDNACFMYIHDVMVRPEYQGKKIGTMVMKKLLDKTKELRQINPNLRIYLGASKDKEGFYEKFGFVDRSAADLGAGMVLKD